MQFSFVLCFAFFNEVTSSYRKAGITLLKAGSVAPCRAGPEVVTLKKTKVHSVLCTKAVVGIFLMLPLGTVSGLFQLQIASLLHVRFSLD